MMGIVVNTNLQSLNAQRFLTMNTKNLAKTFEKLASGYRINKAGDDAAGLQISEGLRSQIRGADQAAANAQDGINVLNTADGAYDTITNNLQRMRELTVQGANDTLSTNQRSSIKKELDQLSADITRIAQATEFNGKKLMDGTSTTYKIQVGANQATATNTVNIGNVGGTATFGSALATTLGVGAASLVITSNASALRTISNIDRALTRVGNRRASIGAMVNRMEGTINNLNTAYENFSASESRIRNVDVAKESANLSRNQILQQASSSILSQANASTQIAGSLLR